MAGEAGCRQPEGRRRDSRPVVFRWQPRDYCRRLCNIRELPRSDPGSLGHAAPRAVVVHQVVHGGFAAAESQRPTGGVATERTVRSDQARGLEGRWWAQRGSGGEGDSQQRGRSAVMAGPGEARWWCSFSGQRAAQLATVAAGSATTEHGSTRELREAGLPGQRARLLRRVRGLWICEPLEIESARLGRLVSLCAVVHRAAKPSPPGARGSPCHASAATCDLIHVARRRRDGSRYWRQWSAAKSSRPKSEFSRLSPRSPLAPALQIAPQPHRLVCFRKPVPPRVPFTLAAKPSDFCSGRPRHGPFRLSAGGPSAEACGRAVYPHRKHIGIYFSYILQGCELAGHPAS